MTTIDDLERDDYDEFQFLRGNGYALTSVTAVVIAVVSGLRLDPHGAGLLILGQSLWFIVVGTLLCRFKPK